MVTRAEDIEIALFNVEGNFHALDNACPHRGGPLGEGALEGRTLTCPWHRWQFNAVTGESLVNPAAKLRTFSVTLKGDDVFVEI